MNVTLITDGSFDPNSLVGGWAFAVCEDKVVLKSGGLKLGYNIHYVEAWAVMKALQYAKKYYSKQTKLHIISDSKNTLNQLAKQIENRILINYRRIPPWDRMKEYIRYNPNITSDFKSKMDGQIFEDVHNRAKEKMIDERVKLTSVTESRS